MSAICSGEGISLRIGSAQLLQTMSLKLDAGEVVALLGPNGAGKSTLMRVLSGEHNASTGRVLYGGENLQQLSVSELALRRSVMSQAHELAFPFRAEEIIAMGMDGLGHAPRPARKQALVEKCAEAADVIHLWGRFYQTLSGGERQRVQFARTLVQMECARSVHAEQMLYLDEPVSSLDIVHQWQLMQNVRSIAESGAAVLVVLHDINLAITYANRIILLKKGAIIADGAPADVIDAGTMETVFGVRRREAIPAGLAAPVIPQTHTVGI